MPIVSKATILNINQSMSPSSDNAIGFCKPMFEDIFLFSCELAASMDRPPYYGDEIDLGFWEKLNMEFGEPDGTLKIVCIGNSLTEGYGGGGTNWPDVWKDLSGYDIVNKGISGETSGQMLARFNADVVSQSPNYCIIECGTNDYLTGVTLATCKDNIQAMVNACLANDIRPRFVHYIQRKNQLQLALSVYPISDINAMMDYLKDIWEFEESLGYPCLLLNDSTDVDEDNADMSYFYNTENDFIHPNALGYEQWGGYVRLGFVDMSSSMPKENLPLVAVIGSSLTAGAPYTIDRPDVEDDIYSWTHTFRDMTNYDVRNKGIGGDTSAGMYARFNTDIVSLNPDYCIMEVCVNDYLNGGNSYLQTSKDNTLAMLNICIANNIKPIFIVAIPRANQASFQPLVDRGGSITDWANYQTSIKEYIESLGYEVLPYYDAIESSPGVVDLSLTADYGHPNIEGYKLIGEMIAGYLNDLSTNTIDNHIYSLHEGWKYKYYYNQKKFTVLDENSSIVYEKNDVVAINQFPIDFSVHKSHQFEIIINDASSFSTFYIPTGLVKKVYGDSPTVNNGYISVINNCYLPNYVKSKFSSEKRRNPVVAVVGSSLTACSLSEFGEGKYPSWCSRFEEVSGYTVLNRGIGGSNSGQDLESFWDFVVKVRPDYCIMEVGINDRQAYSLHPLESTKRVVHSMANICNVNSIEPIFLVCVPPYNAGDNQPPWTPAYINMLRDRQSSLMTYIADLGYKVYSYIDALEISPGYMDLSLTYDNVHPNSDGNKLLGDSFYSYLDDLEKKHEYNIVNPKDPLVVVIGDSITAGYPYTDNKPGEAPNDWASWTATFRELSGYRVINQAIGGTTMVDTEARFMDDVVALHPDYVIVENGNDIGFGLDNFYKTADAIDSIVRMCEENNINLIFVQPVLRYNMTYPSSYGVDDLIKYCHMMHEYETNLGYPSIVGYYTPLSVPMRDANQTLMYSDTEVIQSFLVDGIHPTLEGYKIVGEWLTPQIIDAMSWLEEDEYPNSSVYRIQQIYEDSFMKYTISPKYDLVKYPSTIGGTQGCIEVDFANKAVPFSQVYEDNFIPSYAVKTQVTFKAQMLQCRWILAIMGLTMFPMLEPVLRGGEEQNNRPVYEPWLIWGVFKFLGNHEYGGPYYPWDDEDTPNIDVLDAISPNWSY